MWADKEHDAVIKALASVCELTQTEYSATARAMLVKLLSGYPARQVIGALERCAAECKFRLTAADVISRLDDGRPGAEEAWASFPKDEQSAGLVTTEMSVAWGAASALYDSDRIGARMAFKEAYEREVRKARAGGEAAKWSVSPGFDKSSTESVAIEGLRRGLLSQPMALQYVSPERHEYALHAAGVGPRALPPAADVAKVKQIVHGILSKMEGEAQPRPHWQEEQDRE